MNNIEIDYSKIFMMREKAGYRIAYAMGKFIIKTPELYCPFGIEEYNKKEIINLEIKKDTNDKHNFYSIMSVLDNAFDLEKKTDFIKLPKETAKDFSGKTYFSCMNTKNNLLRCHTKKNMEIFSLDMNNKKTLLTKDKVRGKKIICDIEVANVWIYGTDYGLLYYINKIQVI